MTGDFYEDDEPVADVLAAFDRGEKAVTGRVSSLADAVLDLHYRDGLGDCGACFTPSGQHVMWPCDTARLALDAETTPARGCHSDHDAERHGPEAGGCIECRCRVTAAASGSPRRYCTTMGHEDVPADWLGVYDDGDHVEADVAYCEPCAAAMAAEYRTTQALTARDES